MKQVISILALPIWILLLVIWLLIFSVSFITYILIPIILHYLEKGFEYFGDKLAKLDGEIFKFVKEYSTYNYWNGKRLNKKKKS